VDIGSAEVNDEIGRLATREYEATLPAGGTGRLAFALCDLARANPLAGHARRRDAVAFGLLSFDGFAEAPRGTLLWVRTKDGLEMTSADGDDPPGPDLQRLVARYFIVFFDEVRDVAPELSELPFHLKGGS
jgi:hypothetical protein